MQYLKQHINRLVAPQIRDDFEITDELIKLRLQHADTHRPPILFVPGSFSGAWIWQGNFLEFFHHAGYNVAAMSFGGHGQRGFSLWKRGLRSFELDLTNAIEQCGAPPLLIAHSLGGLIAQRVALGLAAKFGSYVTATHTNALPGQIVGR